MLRFLRLFARRYTPAKRRHFIAGLLGMAFLLTVEASFAKSGLPVPRYVSLGADKANIRSGPGKQYPIGWVFVRRGMPLEVTAEYEQWRKIRDVDGAVGWIHGNLLSNRRSASVRGQKPRALLRRPDATSDVIAHLERGVIGSLLACEGPWCHFEVVGRRGWIERAGLWGVMPEETFH